MDRRAFAYLVPYWRRLVLVLVISLISTSTTLVIPYLSKDLIDHALIGRDLDALRRIVYWFVGLGVLGFALNVTSGLRYTRVSAEILFDMRLSLYAHLQRLSPRFYARTRLGDIVARLNNDISEIQRVAAEAALAWVGNVLFLIGSLVMMVWLDWRLALIALAPMPISLLALA
jgi:ATP-binding cassette, subfamily B, bacterial